MYYSPLQSLYRVCFAEKSMQEPWPSSIRTPDKSCHVTKNAGEKLTPITKGRIYFRCSLYSFPQAHFQIKARRNSTYYRMKRLERRKEVCFDIIKKVKKDSFLSYLSVFFLQGHIPPPCMLFNCTRGISSTLPPAF